MMRESTCEVTRKARRPGKFALIAPVMMLAVGRCVAIMAWMPMARAF